jgi:hypothetical protein
MRQAFTFADEQRFAIDSHSMTPFQNHLTWKERLHILIGDLQSPLKIDKQISG